jgi:type III secretion protein L
VAEMSSKIIKGTPGDESAPGADRTTRPPMAGDGVVLKSDVVQAMGSADRIIAEAREKAREIVDQARAEEAAIREEAARRGYEEGLTELNRIIYDAKAKYSQILGQSESEMLKLSLKIAERIIGRCVEVEPRVMLEIIHKAIESLKYQKEIRIRVNPADLNYLKENKMQLYTMLGESKEIELVEDLLVGRGGCIIDTEIGTIDARLETQIRVIEQLFARKQ